MEATTIRLDEMALRRPPLAGDARPSEPGFRPGVSVVLGDGQTWTLPRPRAMFRLALGSEQGYRLTHDLGPAYDALIDESDRANAAGDGPGIIRAELMLGWHLLNLNYDLTPEQASELLAYRYAIDDDEAEAEARSLFGVDCRPAVMAVINGRSPAPKA